MKRYVLAPLALVVLAGLRRQVLQRLCAAAATDVLHGNVGLREVDRAFESGSRLLHLARNATARRDAARAQLREAESCVAHARPGRTRLCAPCAGIVMTHAVAPGTVVAPAAIIH